MHAIDRQHAHAQPHHAAQVLGGGRLPRRIVLKRTRIDDLCRGMPRVFRSEKVHLNRFWSDCQGVLTGLSQDRTATRPRSQRERGRVELADHPSSFSAFPCRPAQMKCPRKRGSDAAYGGLCTPGGASRRTFRAGPGTTKEKQRRLAVGGVRKTAGLRLPVRTARGWPGRTQADVFGVEKREKDLAHAASAAGARVAASAAARAFRSDAAPGVRTRGSARV